MADDKPKVPEAIELLFKKKNIGDAYLQAHDKDMFDAHHAGVEALVKARKANLKPEDAKKFTAGDIELEHLRNSDGKEIYITAFKSHLVKKAREKLGIKPDQKIDTPGFENGLLDFYSGFTDVGLRNFYDKMIHGDDKNEAVVKNKADFTGSAFAFNYRKSNEFKRVNERVTLDAINHLRGTKHIEDILKYTGAKDHINDAVLIQDGLELINMLETHKRKGKALNAEETYVLLPEHARVDAKYHKEFMKKQGADAQSQAKISQMYLPPQKKAA